jgi:hypothetical protein
MSFESEPADNKRLGIFGRKTGMANLFGSNWLNKAQFSTRESAASF